MRILGIEIGSWSIKAAEMESKWRRLDLLAFHEVRLPLQIQEPIPTYQNAIRQLLAALPSHPEKTVTSLPAAHSGLRFFQIPVKPRKKVEQMYRFELEDSVPFKLDDCIVEHHITRMGEGSLVFAAVAPKVHVQAHLSWLTAIGIDPDWLTFDGMGLINLFLSAPPTEENATNGPTLLIDIGHLKTNIAVVEQGALKQFRSIPWGGSSITQAIALENSISLEEAEEWKMNRVKLSSTEANEQSRALAEITAQSLTPLFADLNHSLISFRNTFHVEPSKVIITGGTSKLAGLPTLISDALGIPCDRFRPFETLGVKGEARQYDESRFAECWGRAGVFGRKSALLFNFRKENLAKQTSLNEVSTLLTNPHIVRLLRYSAILAFMLLIHVTTASWLAEKQSLAAKEALRKVFGDTFRTVPQKLRNVLTDNPKDLAKYIEQKNRELDQKLKLAAKSSTPMSSIIKKISSSFPIGVKVDVNTLEIDDKTLLIRGVLFEGDINQITQELSKIPLFTEVKLQQEGQRFTYTGKVVGR